jgi:hypothetical protein
VMRIFGRLVANNTAPQIDGTNTYMTDRMNSKRIRGVGSVLRMPQRQKVIKMPAEAALIAAHFMYFPGIKLHIKASKKSGGAASAPFVWCRKL